MNKFSLIALLASTQAIQLEKTVNQEKLYEYIQLDASQPLGAFEAERDKKAGYPWKYIPDQWPKNDHKEINDEIYRYIVKDTARIKTGKEIKQEDLDAEEARLDAAYAKGYYKPRLDLLMPNGWTGDCYVKNWKTYGKSCKGVTYSGDW